MMNNDNCYSTRKILLDKIFDYIDNEFEYIYNLTINLCKIPSMTGNEEKKAEFIVNKLKEFGIENAYIDEAGNVIYLYSPDEKSGKNHASENSGSKEENGLIVFAAHIDTVFKDLWSINPVIKEGMIYAPSILDNSVNVAGLIFCIKILKELNINIKKPVLFAFDVGEEGLGNLKGIRHIVDEWKDSIEEVIALDLSYKEVVDTAVGSRRYCVTIETEGGHSWGDFGNSNSILHAAGIVKDIYNIEVTDNPKTTYNVGIIKGGTSINTIAGKAEIEVDLRSIDKACLDKLDQDFFKIIEKYKSGNVEIFIKPLGERPCGRTSSDSSLIKRIQETRHELGMETNFRASSTDANYPISLGIPSISFGIGDGGGVHTQEEYLITESIKSGMKHLMSFVLNYR